MGCRRTAPATELVRVSRAPDGALVLGAGPGRGAWLCRPPAGIECLEQATRRRALERGLRAPVARDEAARLRAKLEDMSG